MTDLSSTTTTTLARALPATFFYPPILRDLHVRYLAGRELAADRRAVHAFGLRPLASALFKVVRGPGWPELGTAAAIGGPELVDVRIAQLEQGSEPKLGMFTAARIAWSVAGVAILIASFVATVELSGGPGAVTDATGMSLDPTSVLLGLACVLPLALVGWAAYRWLAHRASPPRRHDVPDGSRPTH